MAKDEIRKSKKAAAQDSNEPALDIPAPKKSKDSKKLQRALKEAEAADAAQSGEPQEGGEDKKDKKKKKRAREAEDTSAAGVEEAAPAADGGEKKSKKSKAAAETKKVEPVQEQPVKIKKRKPTDPYTLEEISVQGQRAIQYAQTLGSPDFKFNKGRQNWLMRNIYSASEVPEEFVEDVLRYLRSVMGGSRDVMVKAARELLAKELPAPPAPVPTESADASAPASEDKPAGTKESAADSEDDEDEPEEKMQERLLKTGKERAERLLKSLGVPLVR